MNKAERTALIAIPIVLLLAAGVAWAGSQGSVEVAGFPLFALAVVLAFLIQWIVFIPSFLQHTEKFFDLTGSVTYLTVMALAVLLSPVRDARSIVLWIMVSVWAIRLGYFLFTRIQRDGHDGRFDELKVSFLRFLMTWTLQGSVGLPDPGRSVDRHHQPDPQRVGRGGGHRHPGLADRFWHRSSGRRSEAALADEEGQQGQVHQHGAVGLVSPPQLFWRNLALGGRPDHRCSRTPGLAVDRPDLPHLCHPAAHPGQRRAHVGEAGRRQVGRPAQI